MRILSQVFAVTWLNILHLLDDRDEVVAKVHGMLKPGGLFVTSTACLGDTMKFFKVIAPIGRFFGLLPLVKVFTTRELEDSFTDAGAKSDDTKGVDPRGESVDLPFVVRLPDGSDARRLPVLAREASRHRMAHPTIRGCVKLNNRTLTST